MFSYKGSEQDNSLRFEFFDISEKIVKRREQDFHKTGPPFSKKFYQK